MELRENITAGIPEFDQEAANAAIRMLTLAQDGRGPAERANIRGYFLRETSLKGTTGRKSSDYLHDSSGSTIAEYEYGYGPDGNQNEAKTNIYIAGIMRISGTNKEFYIKDALGSTILLLDPNANIKERYSYAPFGSIDYQNGTSDNTKQFTGKEIDEESGLTYFGARYYNPEIGRWISRDLSCGDIYSPQTLNRYQYVENNPLKYIDPNGEQAQAPNPDPLKKYPNGSDAFNPNFSGTKDLFQNIRDFRNNSDVYFAPFWSAVARYQESLAKIQALEKEIAKLQSLKNQLIDQYNITQDQIKQAMLTIQINDISKQLNKKQKLLKKELKRKEKLADKALLESDKLKSSIDRDRQWPEDKMQEAEKTMQKEEAEAKTKLKKIKDVELIWR